MLLFQILPGHDYAFDEADLEKTSLTADLGSASRHSGVKHIIPGTEAQSLSACTLVALYTRQIVSPNKFATLKMVSSGNTFSCKERRKANVNMRSFIHQPTSLLLAA